MSNLENTNVVTDNNIRDLRTEALKAGDIDMAAICLIALDGDDLARQQCAEAIKEGRG